MYFNRKLVTVMEYLIMIIAEVIIEPIGTDSTSVSEYVAQAEKVLQQHTNIKFQLTPMSTIIEAKLIDDIFSVVKEMHESVFKKNAKRVSTSLKIDDRRDKEANMDDKVLSVKSKL